MTTYPLNSIVRYISQAGEFVEEIVPEYEQLFEQASSLVRQRSGERAEGEMLLSRGQQLLVNGHHREALLALGKARMRLAKEESLEDSCRAALACCDAYLHMQLFWAARMEALIGVVLALRITDGGFVDPFLGFLSAKRMCWCELALGRVAPFLAWYEICRLSLSQLDPDIYRVDQIADDLQQFEFSLGCFFLNLDEDDARELSELVPGLETLFMPMARDALSYACGDGDQVASELAEQVGTTVDEVHESFEQWRSQMPEDRILRNLTGETRSHWRFETKIMGVSFRVTSRNTFGPILFAENLLGVLEMLLALARWEQLAFIVDEVTFKVDENRSGRNPPIKEPFNADQASPTVQAHYELVFKPDMISWMIENRVEFCGWLHQFVLRVIFDATIDPMEDLIAEMDQWGEEGTFDRALSASPTCIVVSDFVGKERYDLNYWYDPPIHRRFNEEQAMEQIRNRYTIIREKIPNQLDSLQQDSHFREFCDGLYSRGYKDWMIFATIYNVVLNLKLRERRVDYLARDAAESAMPEITSATIEDVYPANNFIGAEFERCMGTFNMTCLLTWGFHPRLRLLKPDVIERFLRERLRHFDFDISHDPVFGDPPGDWPL